MRWFRQMRSWGGGLALFALLLQLGLSLGHIHAGIHDERLTSSRFDVAAVDRSSDQQQHHDGDTCAICVALHLTATSMLPVPIVLDSPDAIHAVWTQDALRGVAYAHNATVRARGPPQA